MKPISALIVNASTPEGKRSRILLHRLSQQGFKFSQGKIPMFAMKIDWSKVVNEFVKKEIICLEKYYQIPTTVMKEFKWLLK